jgi:O-antigen/teichoic acid export membrane protein
MGFSKWMLFNNVVVFLRERITDFTLGRMLGPRALGLFNVGNEFSNLTLTELAAPLNRALLPGFAKIQHDRAAANAIFNALISVLALIALPAAIGISAVAPYLVSVVLGGKWLDAVPLMEILALAGGMATFQSPICSILISHGRPDLVLRGHVAYIAFAIVALLLLVPSLHAIGAAYAVLGAAAFSTPIFLWMLSSTLGYSARDVVSHTARPLVAAAAMHVIVRAVLPVYSIGMPTHNALGLLLGGVALGASVYVSIVSLLWLAAGRPAGGESLALDAIHARLPRRPLS